jgi:hypothetical protein
MLDSLKLNSFSEHLNTKFRFYIDADKSVDLEMVEAADRGSNPRQERFAILFRGPLDVALEQGMYKTEHDKLGSFDLFIVPVSTNQNGREYEATFNRLLR